MDCHEGKPGGWMLTGECTEEGVEDKDLCPFLVVTLI